MMAGIPADASETEGGSWEVILCNPLIGSLEIDSTWEAAKAVGVKGIEIHVSSDLSCSRLTAGGETPYSFDTSKNAGKIQADAKKYDLQTPVICAPLRFDPDKDDSENLKWAKTLIENAPAAGAHLVYFPLGAPRTMDDKAFLKRALAVLKELTAHGKIHGIEITIENLQHFCNRPEIVRPMLKKFSPDEFGLCLDPTNLYWYGYTRPEIYDFVKEYAPRTKHFHAKNVKHPEDQRDVRRKPGWMYGEHSVAVPDGDLDFKKIMNILKKAGFHGYVSIEDDSLGHYKTEERLDVLKKDVHYLRSIIAGLQ